MVRPRASRSGFSIVEVAISTVLFVSLTGAIVMASTQAAGTFAQSSATGDLNARAARALQRVSEELIGARWVNVTPMPTFPADSASLEFECPVDTTGGTVTWGGRRQIALQLAVGEVDNGLDDNGNGLIDERSIALVEDPGGPNERRTVIVNGVSELLEGEQSNAVDDNGNGLADEAGLSFTEVNGKLIIRLTLQRQGPGGNIMTRTQQMELVLRNRG